jgi:hypothetical protein
MSLSLALARHAACGQPVTLHATSWLARPAQLNSPYQPAVVCLEQLPQLLVALGHQRLSSEAQQSRLGAAAAMTTTTCRCPTRLLLLPLLRGPTVGQRRQHAPCS